MGCGSVHDISLRLGFLARSEAYPRTQFPDVQFNPHWISWIARWWRVLQAPDVSVALVAGQSYIDILSNGTIGLNDFLPVAMMLLLGIAPVEFLPNHRSRSIG